MPKPKCYGCDGRGWVQTIRAERVTPFLDRDSKKPIDGHAVQTREFQIEFCPICKGHGDANFVEITGGETMAVKL